MKPNIATKKMKKTKFYHNLFVKIQIKFKRSHFFNFINFTTRNNKIH